MPRDRDRPTTAVPVVEVADYGGFSGDCTHSEADTMLGEELFAVGDSVAQGRVRINYGNVQGRWQTTTPVGGYLHFSLGLTGKDAWISSPHADYEFLDADGKVLTVQPYGERGTPTAKRVSMTVSTCADVVSRNTCRRR